MSNKTLYATPVFSNKTNCNANCNFNTIASLTYDPQKKVDISLSNGHEREKQSLILICGRGEINAL